MQQCPKKFENECGNYFFSNNICSHISCSSYSFLSRALHSIPLSSPRFWHQVSHAVETRTAQECQSKYEEQLEGRPRRENNRSKQQPKPKQKGRGSLI